MRWKGAKLLVIAAAFLMLHDRKPGLEAQAPNCRCYGSIYTAYHPFIFVQPICGTHNFDWWSTQGSGPACHSWCVSTLDFPSDVYCQEDYGLGYCGEAVGAPHYPSSVAYSGHAFWTGSPTYTQPVTTFYRNCSS
jgi:hypothetical protein